MDRSTIVDNNNNQRWTTLTKKLAVMFMQSFITAVFVFVFSLVMFAYYLHLRCKSTAQAVHPINGEFSFYEDLEGSGLSSKASAVQNADANTSDYCSVVSRDLYSLEQMGYVDKTRRVSKLMYLDLGGAQDVHYVFVNTTHVPWKVVCSLESALGAVGNVGRVNVFVVSGMEFDRIDNKVGVTQPVSLLASLVDLTAKYGNHRLNVMHVNLDDVLEFSPFQGMGLNKRPAVAKFSVELVLLWQFGGTVLDGDIVAIRGSVYRATDTAVEYGDLTVSSPVTCHPFVYDAMLCTKSYALLFRPFMMDTSLKIFDKAVEWSGRGVGDVRRVGDSIVCRDGAVSGNCYYLQRAEIEFIHRYCPAV
ncbi:uncharacterized protein LOC111039959 [Myzus persicae]|uniref:uncharacterized protein LOC111039959 n=1 Tax=Myzus persicae TaxID=13164 RepID=UPI000B93249D|nr:uncharacterized protein LOC111039959 [Myzus persicae]XP_022179329.1 uncharacterized protein LOC111039959 [Myzus persicae]